jgi:hypothetical protein
MGTLARMDVAMKQLGIVNSRHEVSRYGSISPDTGDSETGMSRPVFAIRDVPTHLSLRLLVASLRDDSARKGVSRKNYAHRLRVIRQQTELLARQSTQEIDEK